MADALEEKPESFLQSALEIIERWCMLPDPAKRTTAATSSMVVKEKERHIP
jgi:hypothetical protein